MTATVALVPGLFADLADDWRVFVVEVDAHHPDVFYVGSYPYDAEGGPLHPQAPDISSTWDGKVLGARQISERQKRFDVLIPTVHVEPIFQRQYA